MSQKVVWTLNTYKKVCCLCFVWRNVWLVWTHRTLKRIQPMSFTLEASKYWLLPQMLIDWSIGLIQVNECVLCPSYMLCWHLLCTAGCVTTGSYLVPPLSPHTPMWSLELELNINLSHGIVFWPNLASLEPCLRWLIVFVWLPAPPLTLPVLLLVQDHLFTCWAQ